MDSDDKVRLTEQAINELKAMNPRDQERVAGVHDILELDELREVYKIDLNLDDEYGHKMWAFSTPVAFVAFIETEDGIIEVWHISLQSQFRPPLRPI